MASTPPGLSSVISFLNALARSDGATCIQTALTRMTSKAKAGPKRALETRQRVGDPLDSRNCHAVRARLSGAGATVRPLQRCGPCRPTTLRRDRCRPRRRGRSLAARATDPSATREPAPRGRPRSDPPASRRERRTKRSRRTMFDCAGPRGVLPSGDRLRSHGTSAAGAGGPSGSRRHGRSARAPRRDPGVTGFAATVVRGPMAGARHAAQGRRAFVRRWRTMPVWRPAFPAGREMMPVRGPHREDWPALGAVRSPGGGGGSR